MFDSPFVNRWVLLLLCTFTSFLQYLKKEERCVRNVSVMADYASLGTPPDPAEVQDSERSTRMHLGRHDDMKRRIKFTHNVRDVVLGSGEIVRYETLERLNFPNMYLCQTHLRCFFCFISDCRWHEIYSFTCSRTCRKGYCKVKQSLPSDIRKCETPWRGAEEKPKGQGWQLPCSLAFLETRIFWCSRETSGRKCQW